MALGNHTVFSSSQCGRRIKGAKMSSGKFWSENQLVVMYEFFLEKQEKVARALSK